MGWLDDVEQGAANAIDGAIHGAESVLGLTPQNLAQAAGVKPGASAAPAGALQPEDAATFAQQVQQKTQDAQALKAAATAGTFSIKPEAAQAMIKVYQKAQDQWMTSRQNLLQLTANYKLGSTPGAKVIAAWNQQIGQQLKTAYDQLNDIYQTRIDAFTQAMKNYQENEAKVSDSLRNSGEH